MNNKILVSIVMGSQSDWNILRSTEEILNDFNIQNEKNYFGP